MKDQYKQQRKEKMKVKFNREYLPMLASFMAINDPRYYLNGFHVKPHPEDGVILTATDGHRLVTIHDKNGMSDGEYILPISKPLNAAAKKSTLNKIPLNSVQFVDGKAFVLHHDDQGDLDFVVDDPDRAASFTSFIEYVKEIDGRFPNTKRLFKDLKFKKTSCIGVNVDYIGKLKSICKNSRIPQLNLMLNGSNGALVVVGGYDREIVALIMPARFDDEDLSIPEFVNFGGGMPLTGESQ